MVTCQSANQLKTPAKVSWAFKMVSQFGSLGYTIMGKTADLTVVQKTITDTLYKEDKPQTFIAKEAGCSQSAVSIYIYIYAFSRRFYPKRLTLHSSDSFTFDQLLLSLGIEPMILALLAPCSTIWATGKPI